MGIVLLLGANAWIVVGLIPLLSLGEDDAQSLLLTLAPVGTLTVGALLAQARPTLGYLSLLVAFPPALGVAMLASPELVLRDAYDGLTLALGALSVVAFVARTAHASTRTRQRKPRTAHPLLGKEPVAEPRRRRYHRRLLLALTTLGGFSMIVLLPAWPSFAARRAHWADATRDGAVLTALAASIAASVAMGAIVGPALRAERARKSTGRRPSLRLALLLGALTLGLYLGLRYLEATY